MRQKAWAFWLKVGEEGGGDPTSDTDVFAFVTLLKLCVSYMVHLWRPHHTCPVHVHGNDVQHVKLESCECAREWAGVAWHLVGGSATATTMTLKVKESCRRHVTLTGALCRHTDSSVRIWCIHDLQHTVTQIPVRRLVAALLQLVWKLFARSVTNVCLTVRQTVSQSEGQSEHLNPNDDQTGESLVKLCALSLLVLSTSCNYGYSCRWKLLWLFY